MGKRNENSDLKKIKLETGTVYQTEKGGNYYFRYQIRGDRKCVSLKTRNLDEAVRKGQRSGTNSPDNQCGSYIKPCKSSPRSGKEAS